MTQEIGFVEPFDKNQPIPFDEFPVGSTLELYQYHSCDTASKYSVIFKNNFQNLSRIDFYFFKVYYVHDENGKVISEWTPTRCW